MRLHLLGRAAAIAFMLGFGGTALASEPAPIPVPVAAGPVIGPSTGPCPTCNGASASSCQTCKRNIFGIGHKGTPYQTHLCPGACFGYFPTQWHRWDEVCPIPYPGAGVSDAPRIPTIPLGTSTQIVPPSKPVDPMGLPNPKGLPDPKKIDPKNPNPLPNIPLPPNK